MHLCFLNKYRHKKGFKCAHREPNDAANQMLIKCAIFYASQKREVRWGSENRRLHVHWRWCFAVDEAHTHTSMCTSGDAE